MESANLAQEEILFDEDGIVVSTVRLRVGPRTYAMSGITSVGTSVSEPSRNGPIMAMLMGLALIVIALVMTGNHRSLVNSDSMPLLLVGVILLVIGFIFLLRIKSGFVLTVHSASGEVATIKRDKEVIQRLDLAINQAIVSRG